MEGNNGVMLIVAAVAGILVGFFIGWLSRSSGSSTELAEKLKRTEEELERYRQDVSGHFAQTAELVGKMTAQYRAVYEHLAEGAHRLGGDQAKRLEAAIIQGESLLTAPSAESGDAGDAEAAEEGRAGETKAASATSTGQGDQEGSAVEEDQGADAAKEVAPDVGEEKQERTA